MDGPTTVPVTDGRAGMGRPARPTARRQQRPPRLDPRASPTPPRVPDADLRPARPGILGRTRPPWRRPHAATHRTDTKPATAPYARRSESRRRHRPAPV